MLASKRDFCATLTKTSLNETFLSCVVVTVSLCHVTRQKMTDKGEEEEEEEKEGNADMKRGGKASRQRKRKGGGKKFSILVALLYGEDEDKNFISESRLHLRSVLDVLSKKMHTFGGNHTFKSETASGGNLKCTRKHCPPQFSFRRRLICAALASNGQ